MPEYLTIAIMGKKKEQVEKVEEETQPEDVGQTLLSLGGEKEVTTETEQKKFDPWMEPYYLENGLRRVAPYHFTYKTYCKERWRGRGILDIFGTEFRDRPKEYYVCSSSLSVSIAFPN